MQTEQVIKLDEDFSSDSALFLSPQHELFRDNALLAGLDDGVYAQIAREIEVLRCGPREVIFQEDEPGDSLYLIAQGTVRISKCGRGGQQETLTHLVERDFFGEMALVDSGSRSAQAATVGHAILGRVDRETWDLLLRLAPHQVLSNFTRAVTKRLRQNNQHLIDQMLRTERLSLIGTTVSSIMHDMSNPVAEILNACAAVESTGSAADMTKTIRSSVDRMNVMARELIEFSRGKINLRLEAVTLQELLDALDPEFARRGVATRMDSDLPGDVGLTIDLRRIVRVFATVLGATRDTIHAGKASNIHVGVALVDNNVRFEVSDTRHSVPNELLPKIFEPFAAHRKANGAGLALAISKAVVEAHHGTIAASATERGTTFQIELPVAV